MKTCNCCSESLPESAFARRSKSPDGLTYRCRDCMRVYNATRYADPEYRAARLQANREWHKENRESARARHLAARRAKADQSGPRRPIPDPGCKFCGTCGEQKRTSEFHRHGSGFASKCKPCAIQARRDWYVANRERHTANVRAYESAHPEWKLEAGRIGVAAYRARKRGATIPGVSVVAADVRARWAMWGDRCYRCGDVATETDHVIALSRGGLHVPANLRPICRHCNATKSASDWRTSGRNNTT